MKALFALNPYIWKYKRHLILGTIFVAISNLFTIYPAQIVRYAMDMVSDMLGLFSLFQGFEASAGLQALLVRSLLLFGLMVVGVALLRGVFLFFTRQTLIVMSRLVEYDLRNDLYDHMQGLSQTFYRRNRTGDLMARMAEDVGRVRMYLGPGIMYTLNTVSLFIIVVTTMLMVNPQLTLFALLPLPLLSFLVYYVESIIQHRSEKIQEQLSKLTTFTQEIFSGVRVVKAYVKEKESGDKFAEECEDYKNKSMLLARVDALFFPLVVLLVGLSIVLTIWLGGEKVIAGSLTLGNIAEFIIYINLLTWPIIAIGWVTTLIQRAAASQVRLNQLLEQRSEIRFRGSLEPPKRAHLKFEDVSFTYEDTGIEAVREVSFDLKPGKKLGILGPTGSGKSTLCALIPRLLEPDEGKILFDDKDIHEYSREGLRKGIGFAPQDVFLFSSTIGENIAFGNPDASREEIEEAAKKASVYENIMSFPQGFDTLVGERGVTLSGGQKQRIALARAWIGQPQLLILDDVLSAVDAQTEDSILSQLRQYRKDNPQTAIVLVSHRISCLQDAHQIIVLEDGRITERGTHADLVNAGKYYSRIFDKQQREEQVVK